MAQISTNSIFQEALVRFSDGSRSMHGNVLFALQVMEKPIVSWNADPNAFYTMIMSGPILPDNVQNPNTKCWHHWLVVNIPGNDVGRGEELMTYIGGIPPIDDTEYFLEILIFKQQGKQLFEEPHVPNNSLRNRSNYRNYEFSLKYNLGVPIAANFCHVLWDYTVPLLLQEMDN